METLLVLAGGLLLRLLMFVLLFTLFATPIVLAIYLTQGALLLRRRVTGTVDAGGARWKPGLTYTAAHAWVKRLWGRNVRVGLDDVARRILSGASSITLAPVGTRVRRGELCAEVRCGDRRVVIPSPVEGIVLERNRALSNEPSLFEREPYGDGWMLRIEVEGPPPDETHRGADSRRWLRDESLRLTRFFETKLGMAAADGGTLTHPAPALLEDEAWREAVRTFLRAA
jgi:glycine cleavage system H protein